MQYGGSTGIVVGGASKGLLWLAPNLRLSRQACPTSNVIAVREVNMVDLTVPYSGPARIAKSTNLGTYCFGGRARQVTCFERVWLGFDVVRLGCTRGKGSINNI